MLTRTDLRRRNTLWRELREVAYPSPEFERLLAELSALTGWNRARILAGLGLNETETKNDG